MATSQDWTTDPFANNLVAITPDSTARDQQDLYHAIRSVVQDIQRSAAGGNAIAQKLDVYFQINAPLRARVERHLRHHLEQLVLAGDGSNLNAWLTRWNDASFPPGQSNASPGGGAPPPSTNTDNAENTLRRFTLGALPIDKATSATNHIESIKKTLLDKSPSLTGGITAGDLNELADLLSEQNAKMIKDTGSAHKNIGEIRRGLIAAARAVGYTDGDDLLRAVEHASNSDTIILALQAAVDKVRNEKNKAIEKLKDIETLTTAINDTMVVPRIMESGDFPRPFKPSSITRAPQLLVPEALSWQTLVAGDTFAYDAAVGNIKKALASLSTLVPNVNIGTITSSLKNDSINWEQLRMSFATAISTFVINRKRMIAAIDSGSAIISDVASALGTRGRFTRDQASSADMFASQIMKDSDVTVEKLYRDTLGLLDGIGIILSHYGPKVELEAYTNLIDNIRKRTGGPPEHTDLEVVVQTRRREQQQQHQQQQQQQPSPLSSAAAATSSDERILDMKGLYSWMADQSGDAGTVQHMQESLAALRAVIAERQQKRVEGRRAVERLERMASDVMRDAMTLLGAQAQFSPQAGFAAYNQARRALAANPEEPLMALIKNIGSIVAGVNELRVSLLGDTDGANFNFSYGTINNANDLTKFLTTSASSKAQDASAKLSEVRAAFLAADAKRRANVQLLEQLQRDLFATVVQQVAVLGGRISSAAQPARLKDEVNAAIATWQANRAEKNAEIVATLTGAQTLMEALGQNEKQFENAKKEIFTLQQGLQGTMDSVATFTSPQTNTADIIANLLWAVNVTDGTARPITFQIGQNTQRLDGLRRDLLQTVSRNIADLGERIDTGVDPRNLSEQVNRAVTAWNEKRVAKNEEIVAALQGLRSMLVMFGVPETPPVSALSTFQHSQMRPTPIQNIEAAVDSVKKASDIKSDFSAVVSVVENAINTSNGAATVFVNKLSLVTREIDKFSKSTNELLDMVAKKTQLLFPGSTVLSTMGTIDERLVSILDQTAVHNYNKAVAEINGRIDELNRAGALFGITQITTTFPRLDDVNQLLDVVKYQVQVASNAQVSAAAHQHNFDVPALLDEIKSKVQSLNNALELAKRQTDLIATQAKEIKKETRDIEVNRLRDAAQKRGMTLDATYDAAATAFVAAFIAFANNNTLPLTNAVAAVLTPFNGIWGLTQTAENQYYWSRKDAFLGTVNTFNSSSKLQNITQHILPLQNANLFVAFLAGVQAVVINTLNFVAQQWYTGSGPNDAITAIQVLLAHGSVGNLPAVPDWMPAIAGGPHIAAYFVFTVGAMMLTPAILEDIRNSTMSYSPVSDHTVAMLLARQMAASVRGQVNIAAQRDDIIKNLNVISDAIGAHASMTAPEVVTPLLEPLSRVLGPHDQRYNGFVKPAFVPGQPSIQTTVTTQQNLPEMTTPIAPGANTTDQDSWELPSDFMALSSSSIQSSDGAAPPAVFSDGAF